MPTKSKPGVPQKGGPKGWCVYDAAGKRHDFTSRKRARDYARSAASEPADERLYHSTRESWMVGAMPSLMRLMDEHGAPALQQPLVSIGIPANGGRARKRTVTGECWSEKATDRGVCSIFVSPIVNDPVHVLGVLLHNLIHAAVGTEAGHGLAFQEVASGVGLTPPKGTPWEEADRPNPETKAGAALLSTLKQIAKDLGKFPHSRLTVKRDPSVRKQTTRLLKYECSKCGLIARISAKVGKLKCIETYRKKGSRDYLEKARPCGGILRCVDKVDTPEDEAVPTMDSF